MKKFAKLNTALGVDSLESVDEAVSLNEEQLELVEGALSNNEQAVADARTNAEAAQATAEGERDTAQTDLTNAIGAFDEIDQTIADAETPAAKATAIRTLLAAKPGAQAEGNNDGGDGGGNAEEDWDTINSLPHNKEADKNS